jgi:hypothetical protein
LIERILGKDRKRGGLKDEEDHDKGEDGHPFIPGRK